MKLRVYLLTIFLLILATSMSAHTMWIEVAQTGQMGKAQEVKVFFGDYSWEQPTATSKWFSDIRDYQLMMQAPDGTITELKEKTQDSFYYASSFVPDQKGVYMFWFSHEVKDIHKDKKLTYAAAGYIEVNAAITENTYMRMFDTEFIIRNPQQPNEILCYVNGEPLSNELLTVVKAHEKGESLLVNTDGDGRIVFPANWKGDYLIEISKSSKVADGMHNGKPFQFDYKEFTYKVSL